VCLFTDRKGELVSGSRNDPTEPIRLKASDYPATDEGTACTQSSFKTGKRAFLYIGMQGGRYKAMFKLQESMSEAAELATKEPDRYEVGSTAWVTARFTADQPMPRKLWKKWLDESYELSVGRVAGKTSTRKTVAAQKSVKKKAAGRRPSKKK
jgi:YjbR